MFYDTFRRLCEEKGVSCNKAALEIGLSNSTPTKWKKTGAIPDSSTLSRVSRYFGVTNDYLLGFTIEAQIDDAAYKIKGLKTRLKTASGVERENIENALAILEESYDDLCFAKALASPPETEKAPTPEGKRPITFDDFTYAFYNESKDLPDEKKKMLLDMARFMKADLDKEEGE